MAKFELPFIRENNRISWAIYFPSNKTIRLYGYGIRYNLYYEIDCERGTLITWLEHLKGKKWINEEILHDFHFCWMWNVLVICDEEDSYE